MKESEYLVEAIIGFKNITVVKHGYNKGFHFLTKWENYEKATWQPLKDFGHNVILEAYRKVRKHISPLDGLCLICENKADLFFLEGAGAVNCCDCGITQHLYCAYLAQKTSSVIKIDTWCCELCVTKSKKRAEQVYFI